LIVMNVDEETPQRHSEQREESRDPSAKPQDDKIGRVAISAKLEAELGELSDEDRIAMMKDLGLKESGLDRLIQASYDLLELITYFTSGPMETRAWTIKRRTKAPQAAGVIHTDFERGFIAAEVIKWNNLVECNGEAVAKEKGLLRLEGKEYTVADGDVMHFRFGV